ncbi:hypothetical protein Agub_g11771, partial [Astrephomene gubernaculifera]
ELLQEHELQELRQAAAACHVDGKGGAAGSSSPTPSSSSSSSPAGEGAMDPPLQAVSSGGFDLGQLLSRECRSDARIDQAAKRVMDARKALFDMQVAAHLLQPPTAADQVVSDGVAAGARRTAAAELRNSSGRRVCLNFCVKRKLAAAPELAACVQKWDQATRVQVGAGLLSVGLSCLHIHNPDSGAEERAFQHRSSSLKTFTRGGIQSPGLIMAHPQVLRLLEGDEELRRMLQPHMMPMVVEPRPWSGVRRGGFLSQTTPVMKARYSPKIIERIRTAHASGAMQPLYDALTVLGNVPWRINTRVLGVLEKVLESGGGKLGIPPSHKRPLPPRFTTTLNESYRSVLGDSQAPPQCGTPYMRLQREGRGQLLVGAGAMSRAEEEAYQRQCDAVRMANCNDTGLRTVLKYRMEIARQYAGRMVGSGGAAAAAGGVGAGGGVVDLVEGGRQEQQGEPTVFFQPHNIDFRGRAYPLHPHLTHLADDGSRGLLQFGVGKPLGERGMQWLLMQVANYWGRGIDKLPLQQRLAWAEKHLPAVRASAVSPLEGAAWWQAAERPWQMLATCFDIEEALRCGSSPAAHVSYQPVSQDGTCNGLQHYAALARDSGGGRAVNLFPTERPQDVYQAVADAVADRVARAAAQGRSEAVKVHGSVDRKLVKQTVMTYVYGVTIIGAREQVENRLEERGWTNAKERRKVATYIASIIFDSMGDVFGPMVAVRTWLGQCARHATSSGQPVMWSSPLGFPIEQPYRHLPSKMVGTALQTFKLRDNGFDAESPIDVRRQCSGFPPNYIHSLDGAHMMMTAMQVRRNGGCFAAVHDSFWTHASTVDDMNRAIRDTFVELHTRPLLHELHAEVAANPLYRSAYVQLPPVPPPGDMDLSVVRDSAYFFS